MDIFEGLRLVKTKNEAGWHSSVGGSFLFNPAIGMTTTSEDLIVELYREIFFEQRHESGKTKRAQPDELDGEKDVFDPQEQFSLYMTRGRKKRSAQKSAENFYTPLYPSLARASWMRKKSERTIKEYFFRAISQHLQDKKGLQASASEDFISEVYDALVGERKEQIGDIAGLKFNKLQGCISEEDAKQRIMDLCSHYSEEEKTKHKAIGIFTLQGSICDPLAKTIYEDFLNLCKLERRIDRLQWMNLFKTFLRLTTSVWMLAQMQMTIRFRDRLLTTLTDDTNLTVDDSELDKIVTGRSGGLMRPTLTPNNQTDEYIQKFVKARIELNILVALVEKYSSEDWSKKIIKLHSGSQSDLGMIELLTAALKARDALEKDLDDLSLNVRLTRHCENFPAWRQTIIPKLGPGKSIREHLLVLRKRPEGDEDGGYLIIPDKLRGAGAVIFPGNLMLKLFTFLASQKAKGRQLIFSDVEEHFKKYGIDFGEKGEIRPKLIKSLQDMGLLNGSPDAGDSVAVENPFK